MLVNTDSFLFGNLEMGGVRVEVNVSSRGIPSFDIVGLAARSVDESKHRIKAAFQNSGLEFPNKKIVVNLAPADQSKEGSYYDLPIALGVLAANLNLKIPEKSLFFGEISLNGDLRHTKGAFLLSLFAKEAGYQNVFVPVECCKEAACLGGVRVYPVINLNILYRHLIGESVISPYVEENFPVKLNPASSAGTDSPRDSTYLIDSIIGQEQLKRALEISAAGGHNLLMTGPPGSGKTMAAKSLVEILPPLTPKESLEVTKIYSLAGKIPPEGGLITTRPFRNPHHTSSYVGIIGGGNFPSPGEITLAHRGVLFLDEVNEFERGVLEALRQPMEDGEICLLRSKGRSIFPTKFILVASSNPCPCGYFGDSQKECRCNVKRIEQYQRKISGPIKDRIDICIRVHAVSQEKLSKAAFSAQSMSSNGSVIKDRVIKARGVQYARLASSGVFTNSEMSNTLVLKNCLLTADAKRILEIAQSKYSFSARTYFKILKISRTIADIAGLDIIDSSHMSEAIQYKTED